MPKVAREIIDTFGFIYVNVYERNCSTFACSRGVVPRRLPPSRPTLARYLQMATVSQIVVSPTSNKGSCPVMFFYFHSFDALICSSAMTTSR